MTKDTGRRRKKKKEGRRKERSEREAWSHLAIKAVVGEVGLPPQKPLDVDRPL